MNERVTRLSRLYTLRCRMADAATSERKRIAQEIDAADHKVASLRGASADALGRADRVPLAWMERQAQLEVAARQTQWWAQHRCGLVEAEAQAAAHEQATVLAREQMSRMLTRIEAELQSEDERREQAQLDDLFAISRVRAAMTTAF